MISDCDPQFATRAFQELFKLLNITLSLSTAYHPQTDGATEQVNQEIEASLSIYCTTHPEDWPNSLTTLELVITIEEMQTGHIPHSNYSRR